MEVRSLIWLMQFTVLKQHTILQRVPIWLKQTKTLFLDYLDLLFQKIMDVNLRYYFSTKIVFLFFFLPVGGFKKIGFWVLNINVYVCVLQPLTVNFGLKFKHLGYFLWKLYTKRIIHIGHNNIICLQSCYEQSFLRFIV